MHRFKTLWGLLKATFWEWWNDNTFRLAAALAFYTIFSIAPVVVISIAIAGAVFGREAATQEVVEQVDTLAGEQGAQAVQQIVESASTSGGGTWAAVFGIVTLIIGSTFVFVELQSALNHIWDVQADPEASMIRALVRDRLRSFAIALSVGFLLLVSLVFSAALSAVQKNVGAWAPDLGWLWQASNILISFVLITLLFAMIYKYLPDVKITWRDVIIGAIVTSVLFGFGKYLIGLYLGQMAFGSTYGAAGSFVVLLIWVYYSALICFFGAEFTQVFARRFGSKIRPQRHAVRVGRKSDDMPIDGDAPSPS